MTVIIVGGEHQSCATCGRRTFCPVAREIGRAVQRINTQDSERHAYIAVTACREWQVASEPGDAA